MKQGGARHAALAILSAVRAGSPFAAALDSLGNLPDPDRRLAHEIAAGVLRTQAFLDSTLKPLVSAEWNRVEKPVQDILRIGAYQLVTLERVPPYAAVQTAVSLARDRSGAGAARMTNAVLRKLAALQSEPATEPKDRGESHPEWLVHRWRQRFGPVRTMALLSHNDRRPQLVIQPARWDADALAGALTEARIAFQPVPGGAGFIIRDARVPDLPGYKEGSFVVQDPAQARVLEFANFPVGSTVWDACAAPGGKAAILSRNHRVLASDVRSDRLRRLQETIGRAGSGVATFLADARQPPLVAADAVLVDAPCSATGTLARHPDARWRLTPRRIAGLTRLQRQLLEGVAGVVRPGGLLVYATCSLEPEENENQVNDFLDRHPEFRRSTGDLQVFPGDSGTDGAYAARLIRTEAA